MSSTNLKSQNSKFYIPIKFNDINMNPSDPQGLLDESFFNSVTNNFIIREVKIYG